MDHATFKFRIQPLKRVPNHSFIGLSSIRFNLSFKLGLWRVTVEPVVFCRMSVLMCVSEPSRNKPFYAFPHFPPSGPLLVRGLSPQPWFSGTQSPQPPLGAKCCCKAPYLMCSMSCCLLCWQMYGYINYALNVVYVWAVYSGIARKIIVITLICFVFHTI